MAERRTTILALLVCGAAIALVAMRVSTHLNVAGEPQVPRYAFQDFRDAVYYPARAFLDGRNPYDRPRYTAAYPVADGLALYSPLTLAMHAPFALLPYRAAELAYFVTTIVLTLVLVALALSVAGVPVSVARVAGLGAALILSRPGHWNLFNGQLTMQATIPMLIALWCARDRPLLAGCALALTTFKPTYGLPLTVLLLARGEWRPVLVGGVVALVLTTVVLTRVVAASGGVAPFVASVQASYETRGTEQRKQPQHSVGRVDVVALAGRLLDRSPGNAETLALTLGTLALAALGVRRARDARLHAITIACLGVLACSYHQQYDLPVLVLPLVTLLWRPDTWPWCAHPRARWVALALVTLPLVNYLGSESGAGALGFSPAAMLAASSIDNVAVLALLLLYVALAAPRRAAH